MTPDGRFAIAYTRDDDILLQHFDRSGNFLNMELVADAKEVHAQPSLALDAAGNALVAFQTLGNGGWDIQERRVSWGGVLGPTLTIAATNNANEIDPSVAIDPTTGKAIVAYESDLGGVRSVKVAELSAAGTVLRTSTVGSNLLNPSVGISAGHNYLVAADLLRNGLDVNVVAEHGLL
jgi:hypothetical protein